MFNATEQVGELDMGEIPRQWRRLDHVTSQVANLSQAPPASLTRAGIDLTRPGGHRLYPAVEQSLSAARDCDHGLRTLLKHHGATQAAMWSLLRAQFEASFWALWLLDPEDTRERVLRGIRHEWSDGRASAAFYREFANDRSFPLTAPDRGRIHDLATRDHASIYRAEAKQNGADWKTPQKVTVTDGLSGLRLADTPGWGTVLRGAWRSLAGLQHGSAGALLRVSDKVELSPTPGGMSVRLSPSDGAFVSLAGITTTLNMAALVRYVECHQPYRNNTPVDLIDYKRRSAFFRDI